MERIEAVERIAKRVKESNGGWKKNHTEFIDSQFQKAEEFVERLSKEKNGADKIIKLYNIKNFKGYSGLLKNLD